MSLRISRRQFALGSLALGASFVNRPSFGATSRPMPAVIPGTGIRVARTGDDFEAEDWAYYPNHPKSSYNLDDEVREPGSSSKNYLWAEGAKRGTPDIVKRVATPEGGPEGSKGAMMFQTLRSGIPGQISNQQQQDDLLHNTQAMSGTIPVSWSPNCICRVYVPPTKYWEQRDGATFGYRTGLMGWTNGGQEEYWPGIFLHMERTLKDKERVHQVRAWIRADNGGRDYPSKTFGPETWITMGISHTPDGAVHFFLRPDLEDLTKEDCVGSYWCYGYRAHTFQTFFFNVINMDDGRSVSTPWIVDNAFLYAATAPAGKIRMSGGPKPAETQAQSGAPQPKTTTR
jgi:hypothetical protein